MRQQLPGSTPPSDQRLGVLDAVGMAWRLLWQDFWPFWVVGLVVWAIQVGAGFAGGIPYIGACISLAVGVFLQPPLMAGLFWAVRQRIDGGRTDVGHVFEGFRSRYWQSVVAGLPPTVIGFAAGMLIMGIVLVVLAIAGVLGGHVSDEEAIIAVVIATALSLPILAAVIIGSLLFAFSLLAVWDYPQSGWEAAKVSARLVWSHFWPMVGLMLVAIGIGLAAALAGGLACCIGLVVTSPLAMLWMCTAMVYLYRSWRGEALVQTPVAPAPAVPGAPGALPPSPPMLPGGPA